MAQDPATSLLVLLLSTALVILVRPASTLQAPNTRSYNVGDYNPLFANKVHPLSNPWDSYHYFHLPFCPPGINDRKNSLEEVFEGDSLANTLYDLLFKVDKIGETLSEKYLTKEEVAKFRHAVKNRFEFQMYYNKIHFEGPIGKVEVERMSVGTVNSRVKYTLSNTLASFPNTLRTK